MLKLGFKGLKFGYETSPEISNFMTIRHVGAELFHADREVDTQTDRHDKANNSRYPQFCERA